MSICRGCNVERRAMSELVHVVHENVVVSPWRVLVHGDDEVQSAWLMVCCFFCGDEIVVRVDDWILAMTGCL
jgi:hypothetical protein